MFIHFPMHIPKLRINPFSQCIEYWRHIQLGSKVFSSSAWTTMWSPSEDTLDDAALDAQLKELLQQKEEQKWKRVEEEMELQKAEEDWRLKEELDRKQKEEEVWKNEEWQKDEEHWKVVKEELAHKWHVGLVDKAQPKEMSKHEPLEFICATLAHKKSQGSLTRIQLFVRV